MDSREHRPTAGHSDRICSPAETFEAASKFMGRFGITRVAKQTGLDIIGIPVFASFRPNSLTLATNQGKGVSDDAAKTSALMEALEFAVAEHPLMPTWRATSAEMERRGLTAVPINRFMPLGQTTTEATLIWLEGFGLLTNRRVAVPRDFANLGGTDLELPGVCKNTNGLASGNNQLEAIFHGLCEIVERDASSLWGLNAPTSDCAVPSAAFGAEVQRLADLVKGARLELRLFDLTTDIGIPTIMAVIGQSSGTALLRLDVVAGYGTHPDAAQAAIRAITEAAQSRITAIAAARDDFHPATYTTPLKRSFALLLDAEATAPAPMSHPPASLEAMVARIAAKIESLTGHEPIVVPLTDDSLGLAVCKVFARLEDRDANSNWRPGPRALRAMFGQAA